MTLAEYEILTEGFLTVKAAVAFSGLSRSTLWKLMDEGTLPFLHDPKLRVRLIPKRAIVQWAAERLSA